MDIPTATTACYCAPPRTLVFLGLHPAAAHFLDSALTPASMVEPSVLTGDRAGQGRGPGTGWIQYLGSTSCSPQKFSPGALFLETEKRAPPGSHLGLGIWGQWCYSLQIHLCL